MFFTAIVVLIVTLVILVFSPQEQFGFEDEVDALTARSNAINDHVRQIRTEFVPQAMQVAGYNALNGLYEYIKRKNAYFPDANSYFNFNFTLKEIMLNGTMCCSLKAPPTPCPGLGLPGDLCPVCDSNLQADVTDLSLHIPVDMCLDTPTLMQGKNLVYRLEQFESVATDQLHIPTEFHFRAMDPASPGYTSHWLVEDQKQIIFQDNHTGPWQVGMNITLGYSVQLGDMWINNTENFTTMFSIEGLPDPLYFIGSAKEFSHAFTPTYTKGWDIYEFFDQIDSRRYYQNPNGSSFLMRYRGIDESSGCCGVESFINPFAMSTINDGPINDPADIEKSYVDWCWFGSRCTPQDYGLMWNITCVTHHDDDPFTGRNLKKFYKFAVDSQHVVFYNLTNQPDDYLYGAEMPEPACPDVPPPS